MSDSEQVQPRYITVEQAAKHLNICESKIYELITYEGLPVVRFGRSVRINPARLDEWCDRREKMQQSA